MTKAKPQFHWKRVVVAASAGVTLLAVGFGVWYFYAIYLPHWRAENTNINLNVQYEVWMKYCATDQPKNEALRRAYCGIAP